MRKKGIILLITIFFIISITALYLKNLSDSERLIKNSQNIYHMNYIIKIVEDVNKIITTLNKSYSLYDGTNLEENLAKLPSPMPLEYGAVKLELSLSSFDTLCDINHIYDENLTEERQSCIDILNSNKINFNNFYDSTNKVFQDFNKSIENNKQKDYIIDTFFKEYQYLDIDNNTIKEKIHYVSDSNNTKHLKCEYIINISDEKVAKVNTIYTLTNENNGTKAIDLEINFE